MILSIETATELCGTALVHDGRVVAHRTVTEKNIHSERLMVLADEILREAGIAVKDLGGIAVSIGPGSFTGLRIGLSAAKGLAYAQSLPLIPVPTLDSIAEEAARTGAARAGDIVCALIDAKRDEAYYAFFLCENAQANGGTVTDASAAGRIECHLLTAYAIASVSVIGGEAKRYAEESHRYEGDNVPNALHFAPVHNGSGAARIVFAGDASAKIAPFVQDMPRAVCDAHAACSPVVVGLIAERRFSELSTTGYDELEPAYIRDFVTTMPRIANQTTIP